MSTQKDSNGFFQQLRSVILRWLITSLAIFAAIYLVPGIHFTGPGWQLGIIAAIFSMVNLLLRPILMLITCPMIILTLGLFSVAINALMLMLTANAEQSPSTCNAIGLLLNTGPKTTSFAVGVLAMACPQLCVFNCLSNGPYPSSPVQKLTRF